NGRQFLTIPLGTPVEISFVPAPVINVELYATGITASEMKEIGMIKCINVKLDDGRTITWNSEYLNII
ncbi:MAG: hypothetical protein AB4063_00905, partial [Crocosphaera sp.]